MHLSTGDQVLLDYYTDRLEELKQKFANNQIGDEEFAEEYGKALVMQSRLVRKPRALEKKTMMKSNCDDN